MAKVFFFKDEDEVWVTGTFKEDGVTPDIQYDIPSGQYRARWNVNDGVTYLTIANANNLGELSPIRNVDITDVAKDLIGTAYASKAEFRLLNSSFFFRVGYSAAAFGTVTITGDGINTDYSMPSDCDITGNFVVNNDIYDAELLLVSGVKTIRFSEILTVEQFPTVAYTKLIGIPTPLPTTGNIDLTDNHTLELADVEKTLWMNSADAKAVTVPLNADVAIPVNTRIELVREGAGTFKIVGDTGVTIKYDPDGTGLVAADAAGVYVNSVGSLIKRSADVWVLIGVLTAV